MMIRNQLEAYARKTKGSECRIIDTADSEIDSTSACLDDLLYQLHLGSKHLADAHGAAMMSSWFG